MLSKPPSTVSDTGEPQAVFVHPGIVPDTPRKGWTKAITVNGKWTAFEKAWMDINLDLCREKKGKDRKNLVGWVTRQIHNYWGTTYDDNAFKDEKVYSEWKKRKKSIEDYFRNHTRCDATLDLPVNKGKVTFNTVLRIQKRHEINTRATELSGGQTMGDRNWLAFYKKAEKEIKDKLSDDEKQEIEEKRKEYIAKGLPPEEQARNAEESGGLTLDALHKHVFKEMGMRCITLATYYNAQGELRYHIHDRNQRYKRPGCPPIRTLRDTNPKGYMDIETAFREWCIQVNEVEMKGAAASAGPTSRSGPPVITIQKSEAGHMAVPGRVECETQHYQASMIRMFINAEYGLAKRSETPMKAPWREISEKQTNFIAAKYLPSNVTLRDPEKLKKGETDTLLRHWRERQSQGKIPLRFHGIKSNGVMEEAVYSNHLVESGDSAGFRSNRARSPVLPEIAPTFDISDRSIDSLPEIGPAHSMALKKAPKRQPGIPQTSKPTRELNDSKAVLSGSPEGSVIGSHRKQPRGGRRLLRSSSEEPGDVSRTAADAQRIQNLKPTDQPGGTTHHRDDPAAADSTRPITEAHRSGSPRAPKTQPRPKPKLRRPADPQAGEPGQGMPEGKSKRVGGPNVRLPRGDTLPAGAPEIRPQEDTQIAGDPKLRVPDEETQHEAAKTPKARRRREPSAEPAEILDTKRSRHATAKIKDMNDKTLKSLGLLTTVTDMASSSKGKGKK